MFDWHKLEPLKWIVVALSFTGSISYIAIRDSELTRTNAQAEKNQEVIAEIQSSFQAKGVVDSWQTDSIKEIKADVREISRFIRKPKDDVIGGE